MWPFRPDHQMLRSSRVICHHLNSFFVGFSPFDVQMYTNTQSHWNPLFKDQNRSIEHWTRSSRIIICYSSISKVKLTSFYLFHILTFCHAPNSDIAHLQQWTKYTPHSIYFPLSMHSTLWLLFDILNNRTGHTFLAKPNRTEETIQKQMAKENNEIVQM